MKSFDEFKSSLTEEQLNYVNGIDDDDTPNFKFDLSNPNVLTEYAAYIAGRSSVTNLRVLELYHEWLSQQL